MVPLPIQCHGGSNQGGISGSESKWDNSWEKMLSDILDIVARERVEEL